MAVLALFVRGELNDERGPETGRDGLTLALYLAAKDDVAPVLDEVIAHGAMSGSESQEREWGERSAYFLGPEGNAFCSRRRQRYVTTLGTERGSRTAAVFESRSR